MEKKRKEPEKEEKEKSEPDGYLRENPMLRVLLDETHKDISSQINTVRSRTEEQIHNLQAMREQLVDVVDADVLQRFDGLIVDLNRHSAEKVISLKKQLSDSQKSIFREAAIDRLLERLVHPSRDIEFGMAIALLIHTDPEFKGFIAKTPVESIRGYLTKVLQNVDTIIPNILEEQIIAKARSVLFSSLSKCIRKTYKNDSPIIAGDIIVLPKYDFPLQLIDSTVHHSHEVIKDPDALSEPSHSSKNVMDVDEWKDLLGFDTDGIRKVIRFDDLSKKSKAPLPSEDKRVPKLPNPPPKKETDDVDLETIHFEDFNEFEDLESYDADPTEYLPEENEWIDLDDDTYSFEEH